MARAPDRRRAELDCCSKRVTMKARNRAGGAHHVSAPFGTPEHWRERAEEAHSTAKNVADLRARRVLKHIAANYEEIERVLEAISASRARRRASPEVGPSRRRS